MYAAAELMTRRLITLLEADSLEDADKYVELASIRHLPVVRGDKLVGLITHRDLLKNCRRREGRASIPVLAGDVMTREVVTVRPETPVHVVIELLLKNKFGCLPVTSESGKLLGIITEHDLLKVALERAEQIDRRELSADFT